MVRFSTVSQIARGGREVRARVLTTRHCRAMLHPKPGGLSDNMGRELFYRSSYEAAGSVTLGQKMKRSGKIWYGAATSNAESRAHHPNSRPPRRCSVDDDADTRAVADVRRRRDVVLRHPIPRRRTRRPHRAPTTRRGPTARRPRTPAPTSPANSSAAKPRTRTVFETPSRPAR